MSAGSPAVSSAVTLMPTCGRRAPVPPMNSSVPPGRTVAAAWRAASSVSADVVRDVAAGVRDVHVGERRVVRATRADQDVVDGRRQGAEEGAEAVGVVRVERLLPLRPDVGGRAAEPLLVPAGQDDLGALGAGGPGRREPDAGAAADDDDGLVAQGRLAHGGRAVGGWSFVHSYSRPGRRVVISCTIQPLPSGSSKDTNDPYV